MHAQSHPRGNISCLREAKTVQSSDDCFALCDSNGYVFTADFSNVRGTDLVMERIDRFLIAQYHVICSYLEHGNCTICCHLKILKIIKFESFEFSRHTFLHNFSCPGSTLKLNVGNNIFASMRLPLRLKVLPGQLKLWIKV